MNANSAKENFPDSLEMIKKILYISSYGGRYQPIQQSLLKYLPFSVTLYIDRHAFIDFPDCYTFWFRATSVK